MHSLVRLFFNNTVTSATSKQMIASSDSSKNREFEEYLFVFIEV